MAGLEPGLYALTARVAGALEEDGGTVPGQELIDRFWNGLVRWATVEQPALAAQQQRELLHRRVQTLPNADDVWAEFEAAA